MYDRHNFNVPLKKMAYVLYNMTVADIYNPDVFLRFEGCYRTCSKKHMEARSAFGALWAYYKSNSGTMYGIDFWTSKLQDDVNNMRV